MEPVSAKQLKYIEDLLERTPGGNTFKFTTLPKIIDRRVGFLHELTRSEGSKVINYLVEVNNEVDIG